MTEDEEKIDTENHPVVKFANRFFKVHNQFVDNKFFITIEGVSFKTYTLYRFVTVASSNTNQNTPDGVGCGLP